MALSLVSTMQAQVPQHLCAFCKPAPQIPPVKDNGIAQKQVNQVTNLLGMQPIPVYTGQVANASASAVPNGFGGFSPVIHFNPAFLNQLSQLGKWAPFSVLAHEVGHHYHGDATFYGKFTHPWTKELRADFISGYVLAKMGATLEESTRALRSTFNLLGSHTHPDTPKRLEALSAGWRRAHQ